MKRLLLASLLLIPLVSPAQAELVLRQSTASQAVMIGPFVDSTDGNTAETALTIDAADVRISKNGANIVGKNSGGCTHDELGYYTCTFDATDSNTVGRLQVMVHESGALPVYHEFSVAEEAVYDACCAASAAPLTASDIWSNGTRTLTAATNITSTGGTITVSSGAVTAGTVSDKTGYSLSSTQTFSNTGTWTGNLSGSVGSVTGNVGGTVNGLTATAQGNVRTALGMSSANLDTQLAGLDTLLDTIAAYIDTEIATLLNGVNVEQINGNDVCGTGDSGTPWTGCP